MSQEAAPEEASGQRLKARRESHGERRGGLIRTFVRHPTAANLLMALMIVLGLFALARMNTQFFPTFGIDVVSVTVEWPGASAEDIDTNVVEAIEPEVRFLDNVKRVRSNSIEGFATVNIEFEPGTDMQAALSDVETAVGQVTILPEDSERPEVRRIVTYDPISRLVLSGPFPEESLKAIAKRIRDDLLARGIDQVDLFGAREEEIWVEVEPETLRRLDITMAELSERIAASSQDLPSGDTGGSTVRQIRSLGLAKEAEGLRDIEVRALANGQKIRLGDIARVEDRFEEDGQVASRFNEPAIEIFVQRATTADALEVADIVDGYLEELIPSLPPELRLEQYDVAADLIRGRVDLLLRNGAGGLILVVTILFIFLNMRVAFWVAAAIPVTMLATMVVMLASGQSINMVSLFGLIMALGIIVDDAIVVGEHAETRYRAGDPPLLAAERGARRMIVPVFSSSLTTICAFIPLFAITGIIGQIIEAIPLVIVAVIVASLVECFLVLPAHMRGALTHGPSRARLRFNRGFDRFRDGAFRSLVVAAVRWRYLTLAVALGAFILAIGMVAGGRIGFVFFPQPESDRIYANLRMSASTPREQTKAMLDELERALQAAETKLTEGEDDLVVMSLARLGASADPSQIGAASGGHIGSIAVELVPSDQREVRTDKVIEAWRAEVRELPVVEALTITAPQGGPPGREVDVRLSGRDAASLKAAANEVMALLARYPGVNEIEDNLPYGKEEVILEVTSKGRALGFDTESVGRQVRNAFEGAIADRFPRGDEEVTVRVQYPREGIDQAALDRLYLRGPTGAEVALSEVVSVRPEQGFAQLRREDGARQVAITAELDESQATIDKVIEALNRDGLAEITARHGVTASFAGKAEEQAETLGDIRFGAMIGLAAIYIILAWVFASYTRPIVVMSLIPLAFVGAVLGHWLLGYELTILSIIAMVGLSGIVINDSIILVSTIKARLEKGEATIEAIIDGTKDRLRAVILTSATTIGGLTPLLFETSLQAQFLIPMAITITFGLMVTTFLVLLVIPAMMAAQDDIGRLIGRYAGKPVEANA
ncbi:MAG: efflux RND transporter permease subunit [Pseudomonadota bacterium]